MAVFISDSCLFYDSIWCQVWDFWQWMNFITRGSIYLLLVMFVVELLAVVRSLWGFEKAQRQSRAFVYEVQGAFRQDDLLGALETARAFPASHLATIAAAGLQSFVSGGLPEPAMRRARCGIQQRLKSGLATLTTITATAPFVGMIGTTMGIMDCFRGTSESRAAWFSYIASTLAQSLVPTALSLVVAILAVWFRNYLCDRLEMLNTEMANASLELAAYLERSPVPAKSAAESEEMFARIKVPFDLEAVLLSAIGFCGLYLVYIAGVAAWW